MYFLSLGEKILLRKNIDSIDILALLSIEEICAIVHRPLSRAAWNGPLWVKEALNSASIMAAKGIRGVLYDSVEFPALCRTMKDPPYALYCLGNLGVLERQCVSVVGTRRVCQDTARAAHDFSRDACAAGLSVVSGLAYGIDSFAHKGALASGQKACTCAVLPCGADTVVPYGNRALALQILKNDGLLLSEYIPGTPAEPWRFVQRNRIVAALSPAAVVVHAPAGSGALITADFALSENRELLFHSAGFLPSAKRTGQTVRTYVDEGAGVIGSFAEFELALVKAPGAFSHPE